MSPNNVLINFYIGTNKASALANELQSKYLWLQVEHGCKSLLELKNKDFLEGFDLIVIAIGSPTQERLFHDFLISENVRTPVVNTWLEGYGIGGHATLDIQNSKGCLRCAYVDIQNQRRGLCSNLNFLEPNQDVTKNHGGCGELFLPYNAVSAAQTALIAVNLIMGVLRKLITTSSKSSWKGEEATIKSLGLTVTHRYTVFNKSLQILPLHNEQCDLCL